MKKNVLILTASILLSHGHLFAQNGSYANVAPASPTAASLGTYGEVPVNLYTGAASTGIALGELKGVELGVQISLSYNSGGIRVEEQGSWVGMGWSLNAGGVITHTVKGKPETSSSGYRAAMPFLIGTSAEKDATFDELQEYDYTRDYEPDIYHYNFMGFTGSFVFDAQGNAVFKDHSQNKVVYNGESTGITITTDDGNIYEFKELEYTQTGISVVSAFYLTRVTSASGREIITFQYEDEAYSYYQAMRNSRVIRPNGTDQNASYLMKFDSPKTCNWIFMNGQRLVKIDFQGLGSVNFTKAATPRQDVGHTGTTNNSYMLEKIEFKNTGGVVTKRFDFTYEVVNSSVSYGGYSGTSGCPVPANVPYVNKRTYLKKVTPKSPDGVESLNPYEFTYLGRAGNGTDLLPHKLSPAQDHWGYYNGRNTNADLWPGYCGPFGSADDNFGLVMNCATTPAPSSMPVWRVEAADRRSSYPEMGYGTLQAVKYPTQGITSFTYEAHQYEYVGADFPPYVGSPCVGDDGVAGGLRIKEVKNTDGATDVSKKVFRYSRGVLSVFPVYHGYFFIPFLDNVRYTYQQCYAGPGEPVPDERVYMEISSGGVADHGYRGGPHIGYGEVTEENIDPVTSASLGKTTYMYGIEPDSPSQTSLVQTYIFDWQTQPKSYHIDERQISNLDYYPYFPRKNFEWKYGYLRKKQVFNTSTGLVYEEANVYDADVVVTVPAARVLQIRKDKDYIFTNYNFSQGWLRLKTSTVTTYDENGQNPVTAIKTMDYSSANHKYLTSQTVINSDNVSTQTEFKYVQDYANTAMGGNIATLKGKNILSKVIDERIKRRGNVVKGNITEYNSDGQPVTNYMLETTAPLTVGFNSSGILPSGAPYQPRITMSYADKRLQTVTQVGGSSTTLLWGYNGMYLIGEIKNATSSTVNTALSSLGLNSQSFYTNPDETNLITKMNQLRDAIPASLITSYTHKPLEGVSVLTDPSKLNSSYIYDKFGRLEYVKDHNGSFIKGYKYGYRLNP